VKKADEMIPMECIARGYVAGSAWKEYKQHQTVGGITVAPKLQEAQELPTVLFTPSTKAPAGEHDVSLTPVEAQQLVGRGVYTKLDTMTCAIYCEAAQWARACGIILADAKLEWGMHVGDIMLGDEVLTPDAGRFWPLDTYKPGSSPPSLDKQFVRDYVKSIEWDSASPAPTLPKSVVKETRKRYIEVFERITGKSWKGG
jgi:phosphoribosylaminoimidazole-succinocarboxamide synthase